MSLKPVFLLAAIAFLLPAVATAQQAPDTSAIDAFVEERLHSLGAPGAALAIVRGGEIVHLAGYGIANDDGAPVTPQTPFLLASFSKSMTAVAVMQLVEAGQVELDAPIQDYLPWFMPGTPITVRQLLNQTSGLDETQGYHRNLEPDSLDALEQSIRRLATTRLDHMPGTTYEYSNSNYDVLGLLVETVSGQPYADYIQANLFQPLAMRHAYTSLEAARAAGMSNAFYPFFGRQTNFDALMPYSRAVQPSAGLIASVEDMAHYLAMHLDEGRFEDAQLLSPAAIDTLHAPAVATAPVPGALEYAMGWAIWPFDDAALPGQPVPTALSHGGEWLGFQNIMLLIPAYDLGLVLLMNGRDPTAVSAFSNIIFDVTLLALGLEVQNYAPHEDFLLRNLRPIGAALFFLLLASALFSWRRLRSADFGARHGWFFLGLAVLDAALLYYFLFVRLPGPRYGVPQTLRFEPDFGLMLLLLLLLSGVWGAIRSLWAFRRWRAAAAREATPVESYAHV
jgi:CubicO group peptidase (beta-lactamase class C family)